MRDSSSIFLIKIDVSFNKYYLNKVVFIFVFLKRKFNIYWKLLK